MNLSYDDITSIQILRKVVYNFLKLGSFWQLVLDDRLDISRCYNFDLLNDLLKFFIVDTVEVVSAVLPLELLLKCLYYCSNLSI